MVGLGRVFLRPSLIVFRSSRRNSVLHNTKGNLKMNQTTTLYVTVCRITSEVLPFPLSAEHGPERLVPPPGAPPSALPVWRLGICLLGVGFVGKRLIHPREAHSAPHRK